MKIDHLSPTQINMFLRCPMQWYWRYAEGLVLPPAGGMIKGRAVHRGLEGNYKQKVETFEDLPVDDVVGIAVAAFDEEKDQVDWTQEEDPPGKHLDAVVAMTEAYQRELAPEIQPIAAEEGFAVDVEGFKVVGIMDVVTTKGPRDTKTSGRTPVADVAEKSLQLACYGIAYEEIYGVEAEESSLDYVVHTKKETKTAVRRIKPSAEMANVFRRTVSGVGKAIENEVFFPNIDGWHCSEKWCGYWHICRKG